MINGIKAIFEVVDRATAPFRKIGFGFDGMRKAGERATAGFKQFGIALKNLGSLAVKTGTLIAGAFTAATAAAGALIAHTMEAAKAASLGAERTGIALKTFQGLAYAAERSGSGIDEMADAVKDFNEKIVDAVSGNKDLASAFQRMHVKLKDAKGQLRPTEAILLDVADAFSKVPDGAKKSAAAMALFGDAGVQLIPMLNKGRGGLTALMAEAERLGLVLDNDAAASFKRLDANMARVRSAAQGLGFSIAGKLIPTIEPLITRITDWIMANRDLIATRIDAWVKRLPGIVADATAAVERWRKALAPIAAIVRRIVNAIGPMNAVLGALAAVLGGTLIAVLAPAARGILLLAAAIGRLSIALLTNPIGLFILAVVALGAAAYLIYQNWDGIAEWFDQLWAKVKAKFVAFKDWVVGSFKQAFNDALTGIQNVAQSVTGWLQNAWDGVRNRFEAFRSFVVDTFGTGITGAINGIMDAASTVVTWLQTNLANGMKAAFDLAYSYVKPVIDTITDAIASIKGGLEWLQSLSPTNLLSSSSDDSPPVAAAAAPVRAITEAMTPNREGGTASGRVGRIDRPAAAQRAPGARLDTIFGPSGRAGPVDLGNAARQTSQNDLKGKLDITVHQDGRRPTIKHRFDSDVRVNVNAGLSNAMG